MRLVVLLLGGGIFATSPFDRAIGIVAPRSMPMAPPAGTGSAISIFDVMQIYHRPLPKRPSQVTFFVLLAFCVGNRAHLEAVVLYCAPKPRWIAGNALAPVIKKLAPSMVQIFQRIDERIRLRDGQPSQIRIALQLWKAQILGLVKPAEMGIPPMRVLPLRATIQAPLFIRGIVHRAHRCAGLAQLRRLLASGLKPQLVGSNGLHRFFRCCSQRSMRDLSPTAATRTSP